MINFLCCNIVITTSVSWKPTISCLLNTPTCNPPDLFDFAYRGPSRVSGSVKLSFQVNELGLLLASDSFRKYSWFRILQLMTQQTYRGNFRRKNNYGCYILVEWATKIIIKLHRYLSMRKPQSSYLFYFRLTFFTYFFVIDNHSLRWHHSFSVALLFLMILNVFDMIHE